jgi:hypothetical protein
LGVLDIKNTHTKNPHFLVYNHQSSQTAQVKHKHQHFYDIFLNGNKHFLKEHKVIKLRKDYFIRVWLTGSLQFAHLCYNLSISQPAGQNRYWSQSLTNHDLQKWKGNNRKKFLWPQNQKMEATPINIISHFLAFIHQTSQLSLVKLIHHHHQLTLWC